MSARVEEVQADIKDGLNSTGNIPRQSTHAAYEVIKKRIQHETEQELREYDEWRNE